MAHTPETLSVVDAALLSAAGIAYHHAKCHDERGEKYSKPDEPAYTICKHEAEVCRAVGDAITRYRKAFQPKVSPRVEASIAAE